MSNNKKLSIVIPVYNEERTIHRILDKIAEVELINGITKEVILVNDGSKDNSEQVLKEYIANNPGRDLNFFSHEKNKGKGAALHTGIDKATGDYVVIQDADLEYDPKEYNLLLQPLEDEFADVVYGSRFIGGKPHRILFFWHSFGNQFLTLLSNMMTNLNLTDMETCYKMFRSQHIKSLKLTAKGFGFEPEVTGKISRIEDVRIYEVGISYYGRTYAEGKKIGWRDGFKAIWCIFKYNTFAK